MILPLLFGLPDGRSITRCNFQLPYQMSLKTSVARTAFCVTHFKRDLMWSTQRSPLAQYGIPFGEGFLSWGLRKCFTFAGRNSCPQIIPFMFQSVCQTYDLFGIRGSRNPEEFYSCYPTVKSPAHIAGLRQPLPPAHNTLFLPRFLEEHKARQSRQLPPTKTL